MLVVITGPSGVGKTTIIKSLLKKDSSFKYSTSLTSRDPRPSEVDGVDYRFISSEEFRKKIKNGEFVEWSEVYGKYYGRLRSDLEDLMRDGDVLVGIDVQGAVKLQKEYPEGVFIFVLPPSKAVLEERLRGRRTEDADAIKTRLDAALKEMDQTGNFAHRVVNRRIKETIREIQSILNTERNTGNRCT